MRKILIIFLLLPILDLNAQDFRKYNYKYYFDWVDSKISNISEEELVNLFPTVKHLPWHTIEEAKKHIEDFHYIDIDGDSKNEIIYNGYNGSEGEMVMTIKQNQQKYSILQKFFGRIVDVEEKGDKYVFTVLDYSCCGGYVDHVQTFEYNEYLKEFIITKDIAKLDFMEVDAKYISPIKFKVTRDIYNLRFSPSIQTNINKSNYYFDLIQNSNISAVYKKGAVGTAIAESVDSTGRVWWLVIMNEKPSSSESIFYEGNNSYLDYKPTGWMSSRYLEIIQPTANSVYLSQLPFTASNENQLKKIM